MLNSHANNIFVETEIFFLMIRKFKTTFIFCRVGCMDVSTVTFDQFNSSLLNKNTNNINFFQRKYY